MHIDFTTTRKCGEEGVCVEMEMPTQLIGTHSAWHPIYHVLSYYERSRRFGILALSCRRFGKLAATASLDVAS